MLASLPSIQVSDLTNHLGTLDDAVNDLIVTTLEKTQIKELQQSETFQKLIKISLYTTSILLARRIVWDVYYWLRASPPGPRGSSIPFFGDFFAFGLSPVTWLVHKPDYYTLMQKYGPCNEVMSVPMGLGSKVYISDVKIARDLCKSGLIENRPDTYESPFITPFSLIQDIHDESNYYFHRRRIFTSVFLSITQKTFLLKGTYYALDNYIFSTLDDCCNNGNLWFPYQDMRYIMYNNAFGAIFGHYMPKSNDFYYRINKLGAQRVKNFGILQMIEGILGSKASYIIGWLIYWFEGSVKGLTKEYQDWVINCGMYNVNFENNSLSYKTNPNMNDLSLIKGETTVMDALITSLDKNKDNTYKTNANGATTVVPLDIMMEDIILTLFVAQDTTASTAQIGLYILALHQDLQQLVYNELKTVCDGSFTFDKINDLHIFRAFIRDIVRLASASPQGLPRKTVKTVKIKLSDGKEYAIRKNDPVFINIAYINYKYFESNFGNSYNSEKYVFGDNYYDKIYLNAWLNKEGKFAYNDNDATFGWGKRMCPGKVLAIKELYCVFGALMLKYKFRAPNGDASKINLKDKIFGGVTDLMYPCGIEVSKRD